MPVSIAQSWYTATVNAHEYFIEFTGTQSVRLLLLAAYYSCLVQMNIFLNAYDL